MHELCLLLGLLFVAPMVGLVEEARSFGMSEGNLALQSQPYLISRPALQIFTYTNYHDLHSALGRIPFVDASPDVGRYRLVCDLR
jgi:hypothetical protein